MLLVLLPALAVSAAITHDVERGSGALCSAVTPVEMRWLRTGPPAADVGHDKPPVVAPAVPAGLEPRVAFWERIWGELHTGQLLLVDERRPWIVHAEVDCRGEPRVDCMIKKSAARDRATKALKSETTRRRLYAKHDRKLAYDAGQHLRFVEGKADSVQRVLDGGTRDLAAAEAMFDLLRVPREYARLAVVESMLRSDALSPAGALGAYQLMPLIAERYLMVREGVDERRDPVRAALAAAKYLKRLHAELGSWPHALTAYHAGPTRLRSLMKQLRTKDVAKLADSVDERAAANEFGWASQNYYAKVIAVARVTAQHVVEREVQRDFAVRVDKRMPLVKLAECVGTDVDELVAANPALTAPIVEGGQPVPKGYVALVRRDPPDDDVELSGSR